MSRSTPLVQQIHRAWWRLLFQVLIENLVVGWLVALVVAGLWFVVQRWVMPATPMAGRGLALSSLLGLASLVALIRTVARRPTLERAALEVDARYNLKERVVTGLTLDPRDAETPAGRAVLDDANRRVEPLRMSERFPVSLPTRAWFLPVGILVVLLMLLLDRPQAQRAAAAENQPLVVEDAIKEKMAEKKKELVKKDADRPRGKAGPELEKIRDLNEQIARQPTETREQARDAMKQIGEAEEQIQKRQQDMARKQEAFQKQMQEIARNEDQKNPERLKKKPKDDPANDLDRAVKQGDFNQGRDEADRLFRQVDPDEARQRQQREQELAQREGELQRELEKLDLPPEVAEQLKKELDKLREEQKALAGEKMTPEQREQLKKTLTEMAKDLRQLADQAEQREKELEKQQADLEKQQAEATTQEEKDRIAKQIEDVKAQRQANANSQERKDARDLARKFEEAKQALEKNNDAEAAKKLQEAGSQMAKMDGDAERRELAASKGKLGQARQAIAAALDADQGQGQPGQGQQGKGQAQGNRPGQGGPNSDPGPGGPATGRRPESKTGTTGHKEEQSRSQLTKGKQTILDFVPGEGLKEPFNPGAHVEVIRRAAQEAPEALDREQISRGASDMVRGYFDKFRAPEKKK